VSVYSSMKIEGAEKGAVPVQRLFCLREKNQKKINTHPWFFNAFGRRWYNVRPHPNLPSPESLRHQFERWRRNRRPDSRESVG
ncbi:hypothetical protein M405DRAFT_748509, partial [Rhizopogon salebrosus TDB-379]